MESKIYGIEELNSYIKKLLQADETLQDIWVTGEISNFHHHNSGHMYFTLKDDRARLSCVMFKGNNRSLNFEPEDGLQVTAHGYVGLYVPRGDYQFYIDRLEPEGRGALYLAYQRLKERLEEEGLFAPEEKQEIPVLPTRIGVVTSPGGAAIRDILSVVKRRFKNTGVLIVPCLVQGEEAAAQIAAGIEYLNREQNVDLIIVSRGGGSIEDLWPFNEEQVARAIYQSSLPVISGVGHETDFTISDFTADLRAPTPSAAAEMAVASRLELEKRLDSLTRRLRVAVKNKFVGYNRRVKSLADRHIFRNPEQLYSDYLQRVDDLSRQLVWKLKENYTRISGRLQLLSTRLDTLSPLQTLKRGYSICSTSEGDIIKSVADVQPGETIKTRVVDGTIYSTIDTGKKAGE